MFVAEIIIEIIEKVHWKTKHWVYCEIVTIELIVKIWYTSIIILLTKPLVSLCLGGNMWEKMVKMKNPHFNKYICWCWDVDRNNY